MKKILLAATLILMLPAVMQAKETVRLTRFTGERITGIKTSGNFGVELIHTSEQAQNGAVVEIDPELEQYLVLQIDDAGVVNIGWDSRYLKNRTLRRMVSASKSRMTLRLGELDLIDLSGAGHVRVNGGEPFSGGKTILIRSSGAGSVSGLHVSGERLEIKCSGVGNIDMAAEVASAEVSVSGTGSIVLSGSGQQVSFALSGTGDIRAENFQAEKAVVRVSGVGSIQLYATETVEGSISGVGHIRYAGNPKNVLINKHGVGSIQAL